MADDIPVSNPHNVEAVYSNHFGISATMTDFTIYFLEVGQIPSGVSQSVQHQHVKAVVTLPLLAAAGLQEVLREMQQQASDRMKTVRAQAEAQVAAQAKASGKK
jgi:predicted membrane-bound mannosyltransferase